jgi:hypothetical protein
MDKQERGLLLVEKEEAESNIANIKKELIKISKQLSSLAFKLENNPEEIKSINEINIQEIVSLVESLKNNNSHLHDLRLKLTRA